MTDINTYTGNWPFRPLPGATPKDLLALLNAEGIKQALVSPIEGIFYDEPQLANEKLCESLSDFPAFKPVAVLNPELSNWLKNLEICCEKYRIHALKLHPNYHRYELNNAGDLLKAAGERKLPVIIQLRVQDVRAQNPAGIIPDVSFTDAIDAARSYPDTRFIIGGIRWGEATGKAKEIMNLPNVWIDISQIEYTDCLRLLVQIYGTKHLIFGTHSPFFVARSAILKLQEAELSEEELMTITSDNAREVFGDI